MDASLRSAVNARKEPITEEIRTLVVDIVRSCQLTTAHNWELMTGSSFSTATLPQGESQRTNVVPEAEDESHESSEASTSKPERINIVNPPALYDGPMIPAPLTPKHGEDNSNPVQIPRMNLERLFDPCQCSCHDSFGLNSVLSTHFPAKVMNIH